MGKTITIEALDGSGTFNAYVAEPAGGSPKAAVVVIQEVFGINAGIRDKADSLAKEGYLAIAPDLFWRLEPGIELDPDTQLQQALDLFPRFDQQKGIEDIEATIRTARALVNGGKVGAVGYCLGGRLAYMTAARTDIDASVGYYAVGIDGLLGESHAIARPLMLHIAGNDGFVPPEVQKKMHEGLDNHPRVTLWDYPGLDHGFATQFGKRRVDDAARLADSRTSAFFAEHLA
ncbi:MULTISPECIES: dienelactone hydrolase family protein [Sphingomonadales]|uniref:Carboxymethylenebutenolidase n=1 Tax=Edaphosphingomonas haloaromaticamans TaxID=653954 RepID=A0A1S1H8U4_9SPHN|nr:MULTISPECIES: dienelactone hydrolase family protein [Sphingomonas]AGH49760.1 carboxymethylenebutenolidase [Sphingomonas sp. MM-1]MDX3885758.1 dienelactone hydrolase family protein [Sphingomonas sp.]OHT18076.1 Carboxymethylenebutenolidase [Sphingomonas haloaromaticamans]